MHPIERGLPLKIAKVKAREKLGLNDSQTVLLFFGLIRAYKGLDLLLKALKDHPDKHLLIVGECYEKWDKYQHLIDQYKIEKQLTVINRYVEMEEAASYFSAADATVLPYITASQSGVLSLAYHFETPWSLQITLVYVKLCKKIKRVLFVIQLKHPFPMH